MQNGLIWKSTLILLQTDDNGCIFFWLAYFFTNEIFAKYFTEQPIVCDGRGFWSSYIDDNPKTWKCCNSSNPCTVGQGHCNSDDDCYGGLKCGRKNCNSPFPSNANCCYQSFNGKQGLALLDKGGRVLFAQPLSTSIANFLWMGISVSIPNGFSCWMYSYCQLKSKNFLLLIPFKIFQLFKNFIMKIDLKEKNSP